MDLKQDLISAAKNLPTSSGVYKMYNSLDEIIYVGKAKNLRNRVKSYFDNTPKTLKTKLLVDNVVKFEYTLTKSELDAFSLECNLIKQNQPKYNILLKDDKAFPYIRIDKKQKYPEVTIVRKIKDDGAEYFGPFVTGMRITEVLSLIKSAFKIRTCKHNFDKIKQLKRPCLFGKIGACQAPCVGKASEEEYNSTIDEVIDFLKGKNSNIKKILNKKMNESAQNQDFENSIKYRNFLDFIRKSDEKIITSLTKKSDIDVFGFAEEGALLALSIILIRGGKAIAESTQMLEKINSEEDIAQAFIAQYYEQNSKPKEVLVNLENVSYLQEYLSDLFGRKINVIHPKVGQKKELINLAYENAKDFLQKQKASLDRSTSMTLGALVELQEVLELNSPIDRIECYDISNIQGTNNVSSMVVFEGGKPSKKEYRKFKIRTFEGANDFKAMEETLTRRFEALKRGENNFKSTPDLILIDGGLGQLNYAARAIKEIGYEIPIISLAEREEEVFVLGSNESIKLEENNLARMLLQRIRDEAHRFAVGYHRTLRGKSLKSKLEMIEGVGKKRAGALLQYFKSSDDLYRASIKEISLVPNISGITAKKIYEYLHK